MQRLDWEPEQFHRFEFYMCKNGKMPKSRMHRLTEKAVIADLQRIKNVPIYHAEKGDLQLWGPGHSFTFIRD